MRQKHKSEVVCCCVQVFAVQVFLLAHSPTHLGNDQRIIYIIYSNKSRIISRCMHFPNHETIRKKNLKNILKTTTTTTTEFRKWYKKLIHVE